MNAQRGNASTKQASRQNKSQKPRQSGKSQTNAGKFPNNNNNAPMRRKNNNNRFRPFNRSNRDLVNTQLSSGRLGLGSGNSGRARKSHMIDEDEYIADIAGSVAFATTQYAINPGQSGTFPWGYKIASLYEKYEFKYLEFYYRREVSEYATNGQAGKVMLSVDFDASDAPPSTKQQVLDSEPHVDGMPCTERISLKVDPSQLRHQDGCYVRPGVQPTNTDIKTYDAGNFYISTYGNTNTSTIGELRVRYKVLVTVPVLEAAGTQSGQPGSFMEITSNLSGETTGATTALADAFASTTTPVIIANGIGAVLASTGQVTVPAGSYLISTSVTYSDSSASVTGGYAYLTQSSVSNTDVVADMTANGASAQLLLNNSSGFKSWQATITPLVWSTTQFGTTINFQIGAVYASGVCTAQAYIRIQLL
jgi:hypothetical protein